jgi:hypothetical protein
MRESIQFRCNGLVVRAAASLPGDAAVLLFGVALLGTPGVGGTPLRPHVETSLRPFKVDSQTGAANATRPTAKVAE